MKFKTFLKRVKVGNRIRLTDTFLMNAPAWIGKVAGIVGGAVTVEWDDDSKDSIFQVVNTRDSDIFEII